LTNCVRYDNLPFHERRGAQHCSERIVVEFPWQQWLRERTTVYVHFLSRYLAQLDNVAPVMMVRNDPTLTSDYGALGLTP